MNDGQVNRAVATVDVGSHDHGPFVFKETPYGADILPDGKHELYATPIPTNKVNCPKPEDFVCVERSAVNWLKKNYPELCIQAGLCERIGDRLYTRTGLSRSQMLAVEKATGITP